MRSIKRSQKRRGAAMVEAAFVLPVFFTFVFGMMEMSQMGMTAQLITDAALEGCRVAVIDGKTQTDVNDTVQTIMNSVGITKYSMAITPNFQGITLGNPVTLTLSVNFSDVSWLPNPKYLGSATIGASSTLSSERINMP